MKIQCDACEKAPASVICCADEAALCVDCDVEIHAANKLASKHHRLQLNCLSNNLPRCDICQEKPAFIFCVEDRALFCQDCDEPIHVAGSLSGNHQRFLATGIRVALSSLCNKNTDKAYSEPPNNNPSLISTPKITAARHTPSAFTPAAWAVDDFLQLSDYESSDKRESSVGLGDQLEWFVDVGLFHEQHSKEGLGAAQVPELADTHQASNVAFYRPSKPAMPHKKARIEVSEDEDDFFTVPDLG